MKKLLLLILTLVIISIAVSSFNISAINDLVSFSYCDQPIRYRVDTVDPKFNLWKDDFAADVDEAVQIWEQVIDKNLFVYDPKGDLSINLVYDERQSLTTQINKLENKVQSEKQSLNPQMDEYKRLASSFKQKLADFNKQAEYWTSQGGAPPDEYDKLVKQQQDLQIEANNLNALAQKLNLSTDIYNAQVDHLNQTVSTFNDALEQRPEEGIFKGQENKIEIYLNNSKSELVHTLAHELGHALGVGHVNDAKAIMYPKTSQKLIATSGDIQALENACKKHTYFEVFEKGLVQINVYYQQALNSYLSRP